MGDRVAVVDLGSVSTKLLVTDGEERLRASVDTLMGGAALGHDGLATAATIGPEALARVDGALAGFLPVIVERSATIRAVTTAGGRLGADRAALAGLVADRLGVELEVLSGTEEARLGFLGAVSDPALVAAGRDGSAPVLTIDIGGGSTEFAFGTGDGADATFSAPIGGAVVTATYLHGDPPGPEELSAALSVVELHVDDVIRTIPDLVGALPGATVIGSGAVVTLAAVEVGLLDTDPTNGPGDGPLHGVVLTRSAVEEVFRTIATESAADRRHNPGLPATRVDDIVGACAILVETMRRLDLGSVTVSQRGLAEGVAREALRGAGGGPGPGWTPRPAGRQ